MSSLCLPQMQLNFTIRLLIMRNYHIQTSTLSCSFIHFVMISLQHQHYDTRIKKLFSDAYRHTELNWCTCSYDTHAQFATQRVVALLSQRAV